MKLKVLSNIHKGMYVQFDISGDKEHYNFWHKNSLYLDEAVFGIFTPCFEKCVEKFIYYGPTLFRETELLRVQKELENNKEEFDRVMSSDDLVYKISQVTLGRNFLHELERQNCDLKAEWKTVVLSLKEINDTLFELIRKCIREQRVLWVLGI